MCGLCHVVQNCAHLKDRAGLFTVTVNLFVGLILSKIKESRGMIAKRESRFLLMTEKHRICG